MASNLLFPGDPPEIVVSPTGETAATMTEVQSYMNGHADSNGNYNTDGRIAALEEKTKLQDMEISILKSALSDVLNRLATISTTSTNGTMTSVKKSPVSNKSTNGKSAKLTRSSSENSMKMVKPQQATKLSNHVKQRSQSVSKSPVNSALEETSSNRTTPVKRRTPKTSFSSPRNSSYRKSVSDLEEQHETTDADGKPKLILAMKRQNSKKRISVHEDSTSPSPMEDSVKFYIRGRGIRLHRPTVYKEANPEGHAPEEQLKLEWVYGYRGKDSRDNLFLLPSGELAYNMAGVVVFHDHENKKQRHYTQHTDDVKCVAFHPNQKIFASGQVASHDAKPHVIVWDSTNLETLNSFGHDTFERGVCALEFSKETGNYLACIDESNDHVIYLYEWEKGTKIGEMNCSKEVLFTLKWMPSSELNFMTYGKSHLGFWKVNVDGAKVHLTKKLGVYEKISKPKFVVSATYTDQGDVYTGDSDGNVLLFKEGTSKVSIAATEVHKGGTFSVTFIKEKEMLVSGGKDLRFITWTMQLEKLNDLGSIQEQYGPPRCCLYDTSSESFIIGTSKNCVVKVKEDWSEEKLLVQGHSEEMWGLATHPTKQIFVTCSHENLVCVWDSEKQEVIWSYVIDDSAQSAGIHPIESYVLVGTKSGSVYLLDYSTKEEVITLPVARDIIDDIKVSPDAKHVAMACRDSSIYLYNWPQDVSSFKKPKVLQGHSSRVLHLDWSVDSEFLQSNSSDYEVLFWHVESGCQVLSPAALRDTEWSTYTCPFGFPVMGIWPEGADGTDINACSRSHQQKFVATGDDSGSVNLFKYPCVRLKSECQVGVGHSSHVTCVRFLSEDRGLITVGGNDSSVMQWKITK